MLKMGKVEYEFRTTVVPEFVAIEDVTRIGEIVKGAKIFALQQFVSGDTLDGEFELKPYTQKTFASIAKAFEDYTERLILRF
jgi:pyruvate formate lyase activating enzyme